MIFMEYSKHWVKMLLRIVFLYTEVKNFNPKKSPKTNKQQQKQNTQIPYVYSKSKILTKELICMYVTT